MSWETCLALIESALAEGRSLDQGWLEGLQQLLPPVAQAERDICMSQLQELVQLAAHHNRADEADLIVNVLLEHWPHHLSTARCLNSLAALNQESGLYFKAEQLSRQALSIHDDLSGPNAPETATSLDGVGEALLGQNKLAQGEPFLRRALEIREKELCSNHPDIAVSLNNQAVLDFYQGERGQAEQLLLRAIDISLQGEEAHCAAVTTYLANLLILFSEKRMSAENQRRLRNALGTIEQIQAPGYQEISTCLNDLALLYAAQGRYAHAEALCSRALAIREKVLGPDHPDTATSLNNLAGLSRSQGAYAKAEKLYERALAVDEKVLGTDHPDTVLSLNNFAGLYQDQCAYAKAESLYERALAINEKALGPDHPSTATSLNNLASLYEDQGSYSKAEPCIIRALEIREKVLGPDHPDTAISLNNLAVLCSVQGAYAKAEPLYERALAINEKVLGSDHPDTATSLNNLARLYQAQGAYSKAEPLYERALAIREKALGADHPDNAVSLNNLGGLYKDQGAYAKAEPLYERALAINEKVLGPDHPSTATILNNLAQLHRKQGACAKAEPLLIRALVITKNALGPNHPDTATSLNNLALLFTSQGAYAKAEPLYERALAIREKALGPDHPETATSIDSLALLFASQGAYAKAEPLYERALAIREKALGPDHPDTAISLNNLAVLCSDQGAYARAELLYERALAINEKALVPDHPSIASSLNNLAVVCSDQGAYAKAELLYERALAIREKALGPDHPDTANSLSNQSSCHFLQGELAESHLLLNLALRGQMRWITRELPLLSTNQRISFLRKYLFGDNIAANLAVLCDEFVPSALWCRFNRHGLLQEIERRHLLLSGLSGDWADRVETLRGLVNQLASTTLAPVQRQQLQRKREEIEADLFRAFPKLAIPLVEVEEVAASLPAGSLLIEFQRFTLYEPHDREVDLSPRLLALLLPAGAAPRAVDLGPARLLEQAIEDALQASAEELDDAAAHWEAVSERIFSPLREHLSRCRQCFLSPDAALHRVPFAALPMPGDPGRLLAEACQLHVLAGARQLLPTGDTPTEGTQPLVVADPSFHHPGPPGPASPDSVASQNRSRDMGSLAVWGPLPATAVEGRQVAEFLGGSLLLGQQASTRNLQRARHPRVLHVATHGYFLPDQDEAKPSHDRSFRSNQSTDLLATFRGEDPMLRSGLVLAGANDPHNDPDDDGYLTALEATHLDLRGTELVTLSACDTGKGDIQNGEGVYGLQRALTVAGARSMLLSLWKVPDDATCEFMLRFYSLLKQGAGRYEALVAVQREFRNHDNILWREHHYWAAWQLVGDWRPIQGL